MDDRQKAFHEAGHTSIAIRFNLPFVSVSIVPQWINGEVHAGLCRVNLVPLHQQNGRDPVWLLTCAAFTIGGIFAELKHLGRDCEDGDWVWWRRDWQHFKEYTEDRSKTLGVPYSEASAQATKLVREHFDEPAVWDKTSRLADTLYREGTLMRERAIAVYEGS